MGRASSPVRLLKAAWKLAKFQSASERRFENRPALRRRYSNTKNDPVPEGRGESAVIVKNIFTCCYLPDSISFAIPNTFCSKSFQEEYVGFLRKHGYPDHLLTAPFTPTLRAGADLKS